MKHLWAQIKNANRAVPPESSLAVVTSVAVTVLVAVAALLSEGLVGPFVAAAALVGIPAGFVVSWVNRTADVLLWKAVLAAALLTAVVMFFGDLSAAAQAGFVNVQRPLAEMFLWVQIIHSQHVPARRDLMFSLTSSGVMLAVTAASSVSLAIAPFLAAWAVGLVVSLVLADRSSTGDLPQLSEAPAETRGVLRNVSTSVVAILVIGSVAFGLIPAARVSRAFTFPVELPSSDPVSNPGSLSNPSLGPGGDASQGQVDGSFGQRASFGYFGFADQLDTSLRGRPDDTLVMRVRAPAPAFWRGQTFDTWDGRTWTNSDDTSVTIGGGPPIAVRPTAGTIGAPGEEFIQTFYLEARGPNVIFGAYRMTDIYFGDRFLFEMTDGTVLTGVDLEPGTVYTVISSRPPITAELLRAVPSDDIPADVAARYLQVPSGTPRRVIDLAEQITRHEPTIYGKVEAIQDWLAANTSYTLDVPPLEAGQDAVDEYLFETRLGFCEQIGTSLVVMLRSQGVPARLVVGFTPGERNPFTGLFEVRASDAHAWAEVYFPGIGWQGFDPTAEVPLAGDAELGSAAEGLASYLAQRAAFLAPLTGGIAAVLGGLAIGGAIVALGVRWWTRRRALRRRSWASVMLDRIEAAGARRGRTRHRHETTREYVAALDGGPLEDPRWPDLIEVVSQAQLGRSAPDLAGRHRAEATLDEILDRHPVSLSERLRFTMAAAGGSLVSHDRPSKQRRPAGV